MTKFWFENLTKTIFSIRGIKNILMELEITCSGVSENGPNLKPPVAGLADVLW